MTCEICNQQTATMWCQPTSPFAPASVLARTFLMAPEPVFTAPEPLMSCDDCGPQLGYEILASLTTNIRSRD